MHPRPTFFRTNTVLMAKLIKTGLFLVLLPSSAIGLPQAVVLANKNHQNIPKPIRSDRSGKFNAEMNIAKIAHKTTAPARCLVFHG